MPFHLQAVRSDKDKQAHCEVCDKDVEAVALIKSTWVCAGCIRAALDDLGCAPCPAEPQPT